MECSLKRDKDGFAYQLPTKCCSINFVTGCIQSCECQQMNLKPNCETKIVSFMRGLLPTTMFQNEVSRLSLRGKFRISFVRLQKNPISILAHSGHSAALNWGFYTDQNTIETILFSSRIDFQRVLVLGLNSWITSIY